MIRTQHPPNPGDPVLLTDKSKALLDGCEGEFKNLRDVEKFN